MVMSPCIGISGTWHLTWDTVTLPGWSLLPSPAAPVLSRHDVTLPPLCSPPPPIQFPSHLAWRGGSVSQNIEVSAVFYSMSKQTGPTDTWHRWSHRDQALSHGTLETWRASSDEMSQWRQAGVIYRGLKSAKLSRTWGLPLGPPSDTQTQSNSQKHEH